VLSNLGVNLIHERDLPIQFLQRYMGNMLTQPDATREGIWITGHTEQKQRASRKEFEPVPS
jgi:hypothetical protein